MMIRRLKKDVLSELPPKTRQTIQIDCEEKLVKQIKKIMQSLGEINLDKQDQNLILVIE